MSVRALAVADGIFMGDDDVVGCEEGAELVVMPLSSEGRVRVACLPPRPAPLPPCPPRSVRESSAACTSIGREIVDAALWLRAVIGPDGGEGAGSLCADLERSATAAVPPGVPVDRKIEVELRFPDNDVTQLDARVAPALAESVVLPRLEALRSLGGVSRAVEVRAAVHCRGHSSRARSHAN